MKHGLSRIAPSQATRSRLTDECLLQLFIGRTVDVSMAVAAVLRLSRPSCR